MIVITSGINSRSPIIIVEVNIMKMGWGARFFCVLHNLKLSKRITHFDTNRFNPIQGLVMLYRTNNFIIYIVQKAKLIYFYGFKFRRIILPKFDFLGDIVQLNGYIMNVYGLLVLFNSKTWWGFSYIKYNLRLLIIVLTCRWIILLGCLL